MNFAKIAMIVVVTGLIGYLIYIAVGVSSTYPAINTYRLATEMNSLDKKLANKVASSVAGQ